MKNKNLAIVVFVAAAIFLSSSVASGQTATAWGYSTGYGNVYGSFGLASTMQSMYNVARAQALRKSAREAAVKKPAAASNQKLAMPPPGVARNYGIFRPDPAVDTGKLIAEGLGDTPEEKDLIRKIFTATKAAYEKEAAARGWKNNVAAGITFFTITALTVYHDTEEPNDAAVNDYFQLMNSAIDEIPEFASVSNKDKQGFNDMLVGFSGLLLVGYTEGKENKDAATIATYQKLAGALIQLVLKTDPENLRLENGQIVIK
jgi:hypothetical protein